MHTGHTLAVICTSLVGNGYVQPGVHNKRFLFLVGIIDEHGSNLAVRVDSSRRNASSGTNFDDAQNVVEASKYDR